MDQNEAAPTFGAASYTVTDIAEDSSIGTTLTLGSAITASDTDPTDTLTFTLEGKPFCCNYEGMNLAFGLPDYIVSVRPQFRRNSSRNNLIFFTLPTTGTDASSFEIDAQSNTDVKIKTAVCLDYETKTSYTFDIKVSDGTNDETRTLNVAVADVNDNAPVCNPSAYFSSIAENTGTGKLELVVRCCFLRRADLIEERKMSMHRCLHISKLSKYLIRNSAFCSGHYWHFLSDIIPY